MNWDDYFFSIADTVSLKSKDNDTKVGAVIIDPLTHKILGTGYNSLPAGVNDGFWPKNREDKLYIYKEEIINKLSSAELVKPIGEITKYDVMVHAEINAIINAQRNLLGSVLYVTQYYPCNRCACTIINAGIKKVVIRLDKEPSGVWVTPITITKKLFSQAGIEIQLYHKAIEKKDSTYLSCSCCLRSYRFPTGISIVKRKK